MEDCEVDWFASDCCKRARFLQQGPSLGLWPRQSRLPQVIGKVRGSSEQYSKSIPVRFPLEILFRNRGMPLPPIRGRELRKTLPQLLVDFPPCGFERLSRDRQRNGFVRSFHVGLPPAEGGVDERFLCGHSFTRLSFARIACSQSILFLLTFGSPKK